MKRPTLAAVTRTRARVMARLRRPRILPPEPLGTLVADGLTFPVRDITLARGGFVVTGSMLRLLTVGRTWNPRTYELHAPDGSLVRAGKFPHPVGPMVVTSSMKLDLTLMLSVVPPDAEIPRTNQFRLPRSLD